LNANNDGIDIDGCRDVTLSDFTSDTEDDGITLKSTSPRLTENVVITNCIVSSHWAAIKFGTETNGGFKNVAVSNCVIKAPVDMVWGGGFTDVPLTGIHLNIVDGGIMENISFSNISIDKSKSPIYIRLGNRARPYFKNMRVDNVGKVCDITIDNVRITNGGKYGCSITGLPGFPVERIRLSNIVMQLDGSSNKEYLNQDMPEDPKKYPAADENNPLPVSGFFLRHVNDITFSGIEVYFKQEDIRPAFILDDVVNANFSNIQLQSSDKPASNLLIKNSKNIVIQNSVIKGKSNCFVKVEGADSENIAIVNNVLFNTKTVFSAGPECKTKVKEQGNIR
jgi:hypothetical protein